MSKMRVYEYAKKNELSSKQVIEKLQSLNIEVNNHMSTLEDGSAEKLDKAFGKSAGKQKQDNKSGNSKPNNKKQGNQKSRGNNQRRQKPSSQQQAPKKPKKQLPEKITFVGSLTVGELAEKLGKDSSEIIKKLMFLGVMATKNQELEPESIELICEEFGVEVEEEVVVDETDIENMTFDDEPEDLRERPAVVTIMGHVDHRENDTS